LRCLEKRPADRWQTADELLRQLDAATTTATPGGTTSGLRTIAAAEFTLTEAVCRQLDRASFDPRLIGDRLQYLDNNAPSDVLVACLPACGMDAAQFEPLLRASRLRVLAATPLGMEPVRRRRPRLTLADQLVLLREWLRAMTARLTPRLVVVVGFSSGGDLALRLAAAPAADQAWQLDGVLALGANLALDTCFVTRVLATLGGGGEADTLEGLKRIGQGATTLDEWTEVHKYLVSIVARYRGSLEPLQLFARDVVRPFQEGPLAPFAAWYRDATGLRRRLRCVFEDAATYPGLVRELQLRHHDEGLLGERYEEGSIVIEPDTNHFDLLDPALIERHLAVLVERLRTAPP
jgi:hypothetical protein